MKKILIWITIVSAAICDMNYVMMDTIVVYPDEMSNVTQGSDEGINIDNGFNSDNMINVSPSSIKSTDEIQKYNDTIKLYPDDSVCNKDQSLTKPSFGNCLDE